MDDTPERNPLGLVVAAFVITLPFDYDSYLIHRDLSEFGILIFVIKVVFFVLYLLGSRFAWHVSFGLTAVITALALLLIRRGFKTANSIALCVIFSSLRSLFLWFYISGASENGTFATFKIAAQIFRYINPAIPHFASRVCLRERLATWQMAKRSSPTCQRAWTGCRGARGIGSLWFRSAQRGS